MTLAALAPHPAWLAAYWASRWHHARWYQARRRHHPKEDAHD